MKSNLENASVFGGEKKNRTKLIFIILLLVGLVTLLGRVLAANITIASGAIEFGQGVADTIACDDDITVTPNSTFNGTTFLLTSVVLTDVDQRAGTTQDTGCGAQNIVVKVHNSTTPIASATVTIPTAAATSNFTVTPAPTATAGDVVRITLETTN
ncbi:MAG: hypothetical protein ACO249_05570 [Candidatus Nanopelagicales bacterium]